eukprot:TRINITY_DN31000_c0_g1_i1.p1 TRINITY_DN31000_c0_g1~~TRINITY_DN31000_c0_g1_i1.p1  ORF type:complete len:592 (+),score=64.31 TRINITY_DN31000_c0_g1_i1:57-1778(+)
MKNNRRAQAEDVEERVRHVVDLLLADEARLEKGEETAYRNKVTYSIKKGEVKTSPLAVKECNNLCMRLCKWIQAASPISIDYWHEVSVKCSRKGMFMVKFLIVCSKAKLADFIDTEVQQLVHDLMDCGIECMALQHSESKVKPKKDDAYIIVHGKWLTEKTPWGDEYLISPDTFSEVNHDMENKLWAFMHALLEANRARDLLLMGRDSNAVFASMPHKMSSCIKNIVCLPHCPRVFEDLTKNYERTVKANLHVDQTVTLKRVASKWDYTRELCNLKSEREMVVLVNSGRGGLAKETAMSLYNMKQVQQIIYVSCNERTCYQDAEVLLTGADAFYINSYKSYDFMPGTEYRMQVFDFRREMRCAIIPIGPPGSGKSTFAAILKSRNQAAVVERDSIYTNERKMGKSLKTAKRSTHAAVLNLLGSQTTHVVYDSTNGDPGGRAVMCDSAFAQAMPRGRKVAFLISYTQNINNDWLLQNCLSRVGHVSFPTDAEEAKSKIANVLLGMQAPRYTDDFPSVARLIVLVDPQETTPDSVVDFVAPLLLLSPELSLSMNLSVKGIHILARPSSDRSLTGV